MIIGEFYEYKGYTGTIRIDTLPDGTILLGGQILNIPELEVYTARTIEDLYQRFKNTVDLLIVFSKEVGKENN